MPIALEEVLRVYATYCDQDQFDSIVEQVDTALTNPHFITKEAVKDKNGNAFYWVVSGKGRVTKGTAAKIKDAYHLLGWKYVSVEIHDYPDSIRPEEPSWTIRLYVSAPPASG